MALIQSPYYEKLFCQLASSPRTIPNSGGTWTASGAQLLRAMSGSVSMNPNEAWISAQWKHGSRSALPQIKGRKNGAWSMNIPLALSGTPGTPPDCDPLLQAIFGGAPTITAGVSVAYNIYDQGALPFSIFDFIHGFGTTASKYAMGCLPQTIGLTFNGNLLEIQARGTAVAVVQTEEFPYVDAIAKGGLTTFPAEPGSFSLIGQLVTGFGGTLTLDGQQIKNMCDGFSVEFDTGLDYKGDFIDDAYPAQIIKNLRSVSVNISMLNTDDPALINLKAKARTGATINGSFVLGNVSGYTVTASFNGLQLNPAQMSEQGAYFNCSFGQARGTVAPGLSNEFALSFS